MTNMDTETNENVEANDDEIYEISRRLHFDAIIKEIRGDDKEEISLLTLRFIRFLYRLQDDTYSRIQCIMDYEHTDDISEFDDIHNADICYSIVDNSDISLNKNRCKLLMMKKIIKLCNCDSRVEMFIRRYCIATGNAYSSVYGYVPTDPFMEQARREWEAKNKAKKPG